MANLQFLLSKLQGQQAINPAVQLLQNHQAVQTTSGIKPPDLPNVIQAQAQAQDLSPDFYNQLSAISDRIGQNRQEAEDIIAQNAAKAQQEALLRRIRAMIPQPISTGGGYSGYSGGGSSYLNPSGSILSNPAGGHSSSGSIFPDITGGGGRDFTGGVHLPVIGGNNPVVAPPRGGCTPHMIELGLCG